jgi:cholesterol transport system auxiliary component
MKPHSFAHDRNPAVVKHNWLLLVSAMLLAGCSGLQPPPEEDINIYVLDARASIKAVPARRDLVIAVGIVRARPGFDTPQIAYVQRPHELGYYAVNRWADTPSHMLAPLIVQALEQSGAFRAVVQAPNAVPADVRLDTELIRLQQDFAAHPSRVEITLRAQLIDVRTGRVLATREFDEAEAAPSENAYGGVIAANRALQRILEQLSEFCLREAIVP